MAKKKKNNRENVWSKILVVAFIEVILIVGVMVGVLISVIKPLLWKDRESTQQTGSDFTGEDPMFSHEGSESLSVTYKGRTVYAGGQVGPEDFEVILHYKDGRTEEISEYESVILTDSFRLQKGDNTIAFYVDDFWASTTVYAIDTSELRYLPSYLLTAIDQRAAQEKVDRITGEEISYQEALADVAFTGDSQIEALSAFGILPESQIVAKVGESLNFMEQNLNKIIAMSWNKSALIVHYGINTLSTSDQGRADAVERYKNLLLQLKEKMPDTRIIVSGLFPVADEIFYDQARFAYIDDYNSKLFAMCCEIGVEYLSDNEYIESHQTYFFGDGLHLMKSFYTEYWLKNLILTMGV